MPVPEPETYSSIRRRAKYPGAGGKVKGVDDPVSHPDPAWSWKVGSRLGCTVGANVPGGLPTGGAYLCGDVPGSPGTRDRQGNLATRTGLAETRP